MQKSEQPLHRSKNGSLLVLALCFITIVFDGYDVVLYGSTLPAIIGSSGWGIDSVGAGLIGSLSLVGMLVGNLFAGFATQRLGRRRLMLLCIGWFSTGMLLTAMSTSAEMFGFLRFLTGIGLGGVTPTCVALTVEYAPIAKRQLANAVMFSGYSVGGIAAAVVAITLLPEVDFRFLYLIGAMPLVTLLPLVWRYLPESITYLAERRSEADARAVADNYGLIYEDIVVPRSDLGAARNRSAVAELFTARWRRSTVLLAVANFCGLLLVYGLNTWLPQIMRSAGYALGSALTFLLVLNVGAVVGAISASRLADRIGTQRVVVVSFAVAILSIFLLSVHLPSALLLGFVAFAGLGSVGTQILLGGFCASYYPQHMSPTALGILFGLGRFGAICGPLIGGWIAGSRFGYELNFYAFAAVAAVGCLAVALVRNPHTPTRPHSTSHEVDGAVERI